MMARASSLLLAVAVLMGCGPAKYEDVSHLPQYSNLIGAEYRTRVALQVLGITDDPDYRPVIEYYLLTGTPSISGPEVVTRQVLAAGSLVQPITAMKCVNCAYSGMRIAVRINSGNDYPDESVFVESMGNMISSSAGGATTLNPNVFEPTRPR